jgi:TPP-dependent pyruvate/acetoin dehydrogenase alpha subunit
MLKISKQQLIDFEHRIGLLYEEGKLPYLMHFCGGNEDQLIEIFKNIDEDDYVFSTHINHYHYLLKGGSIEDLEKRIVDGDSMFIFNKKLKFLSTSILAGGCGIAAGVALSLKLKNSNSKVWCFIGDGAEDEGHLYEAIKFVQSMNLQCTFIIEDNDRSVETNKSDRHSNFIFNFPKCVIRYTYNAIYPHAGTGTQKIIKFDKEVIKQYLTKRNG